MDDFKFEVSIEICEHCGKILDKNEERYLISTQRWSRDAVGNGHIVLINSTLLCSKCYL